MILLDLCVSSELPHDQIISGQRLTEAFLSPLFFPPFLPVYFLFFERSNLRSSSMLCNVSILSDWFWLFSLFCSYNSLTEVEGSEFRSLRELEMLMLHGNDISIVHSGAFYSLQSLQVLCAFPGILTIVATRAIELFNLICKNKYSHNLFELINQELVVFRRFKVIGNWLNIYGC